MFGLSTSPEVVKCSQNLLYEISVGIIGGKTF
jgi:hypothetical protein